jgi:hypothetical protein
VTAVRGISRDLLDMARVIPFPLVFRRKLVAKTAARIATAAPATGEKLLAQALQVQGDTMLRRGIPPDVVERQLRAFQSAVRAEVWNCSIRPGGAA